MLMLNKNKLKVKEKARMGVKYIDTIERMRWAGKLKNDSAVARVLGVTPQALSNYKKRGELPTDLVVRFSNIYGLSIDWLISGDGEVHKPGYVPPESEHGIPSLQEEMASYGRGTVAPKSIVLSDICPDHLIYVGKLLKIFQSKDKNASEAIKCSIDVFCKASTATERCEAPREPVEE